MPTPYIYGQTPLEAAAITQRLFLIQQSKVGTGKIYVGPYKNPIITGKATDAYSVTHPNALSDTNTPSYGKGTGQQIDVVDTYKGVVARLNYAGGSKEDRDGILTIINSGRNAQLQLNASTWGLGPGPTPGPSIGTQYTKPNIALNTGIIKF